MFEVGDWVVTRSYEDYFQFLQTIAEPSEYTPESWLAHWPQEPHKVLKVKDGRAHDKDKTDQWLTLKIISHGGIEYSYACECFRKLTPEEVVVVELLSGT